MNVLVGWSDLNSDESREGGVICDSVKKLIAWLCTREQEVLSHSGKWEGILLEKRKNVRTQDGFWAFGLSQGVFDRPISSWPTEFRVQPICNRKGEVSKRESLMLPPKIDGQSVPAETYIIAWENAGCKASSDYNNISIIFEKMSKEIDFRPISINVNPSTFEEKDFAVTIGALAEHYGVNPGQVILELLEITPIYDYERFNENVWRLKLQWFRLAIDDFFDHGEFYNMENELPWMNYNNFSNISRIEVLDIVKFDGIYAKAIYNNRHNKDIIQSFHYTLDRIFAQYPYVEIVIEHIENREMWDFFLDLDPRITHFQGRYFGMGEKY